MTRSKGGRQKKLTAVEREARRLRNQRRGRDSKLAAWEKDHVVKPKTKTLLTKDDVKSKKTRMTEELMWGLVEGIEPIEAVKQHRGGL